MTDNNANKNKSGRTAYGAAIARLIEQYQPDSLKLFDDRILKYLLPWTITVPMKMKFIRNLMIAAFSKETKGIFGGLICRTKYIDEKTLFAIDNIQQVLILGSGLDTRPYRLKELKDHEIFEVDLASVQNFKKEKVKKYFSSLPSNVSYVAIDFNIQTLDEILKQSHFDFTKPAFIIYEGVTQYLTEQAVEKTFDFFSKMAEGSYVVFTYILKDVIKGCSDIKGANKQIKLSKKANSAWQFGINPTEIKMILKKYDMEILEDVGAAYYQEKYLHPLGRQLDVTQIERAAFAKIIK